MSTTTPASSDQLDQAQRLHQLLGTTLTAALDVADELRRTDVLPTLTRRSLDRVLQLVVSQLRQLHRMTSPSAVVQARLVDTLTTDDETQLQLTVDAARLAERDELVARRRARAGRRG